jgi:hypothetical protein
MGQEIAQRDIPSGLRVAGAIVRWMHAKRLREAIAGALPGLLLLLALSLWSAPAGARTGTHARQVKSSELWATVDICNTARHPDTIGIRGSMPGDGRRRDTMYMRFLVQNYDASAHTWQNIGTSADSGFVLVGSAGTTRQAGHSFTFKPTTTPFMLRGLVEFQWHRSGHTRRSVTLPTTAGRKSLAGDEPKGFSAATCELP